MRSWIHRHIIRNPLLWNEWQLSPPRRWWRSPLTLLAMQVAVTAAVAFLYGDGDGVAFLIAAAIPLVLGYAGYRATDIVRDLSVREGYAVVAFAWVITGLAGALPFMLTGVVGSPVAAVFESISGFTTTGATVFGDIESLPHGILLWRSFPQWLGGMGIIVLAIAVLPRLRVGGRQLFESEAPGPEPEPLMTRVRDTPRRPTPPPPARAAVRAPPSSPRTPPRGTGPARPTRCKPSLFARCP